MSDVHRGLVKGLKANGCDVAELNLSDRLEFYARAEIKGGDDIYVKAFSDDAAVAMAAKGIEAALYEWWPDVVVIVSGFFVPPALWGLLSKRPHHVVYWATESPYEDDRQGRGARFADTVILNDPTNLDQYRADINERTFYLPHSYDPDIHHPGNGDPDHDFVFVGTGFPSPHRMARSRSTGPGSTPSWPATGTCSPTGRRSPRSCCTSPATASTTPTPPTCTAPPRRR